MKLKNFKDVIAPVEFNTAKASDRLSFASVDRHKLFVESTPVEKFVSQVVT